MRVLTVRTEHPPHAYSGEGERDDVEPTDSVAEKHPGDQGTNERCCGEDQSFPGSAEITSAGNPQGDRHADQLFRALSQVTERTCCHLSLPRGAYRYLFDGFLMDSQRTLRS